MLATPRALYTAKVRSTGGRDGAARSFDGRLDISLSAPGTIGSGTNPEQLLAAGWSASFEDAICRAARTMNVTLPSILAVETDLDLNVADDAYFLSARLRVWMPGLQRDLAQSLIEEAHQTCPYSKATRGNIDVAVSLLEPLT